ncbi:MAG: serine/threonine protein kinase [Deltaproteobacteria bacterium]|nr:serine/threonine protein kinase [Deltaproteobacteria bacterium]
MPKPLEGPLTKDMLVEETRFLLKTLLRDDLFGEEVSVTEAEKLLEASLSLGFVDYAAFLKKREYVVIDRTRNTVKVTSKGRLIADGMDDAEFHRELAGHFASRLAGASPGGSLPPLSSTLPRTGASTPPTRSASSALPGASLGHRDGHHHAAAADDLKDGRYTRGELLGQGGLGGVFKGRNIYLNRDVAVKEFRHLFDYLAFLQRDEVLRRLRAAVMAQAGLGHPFVLEVLDLNFDRDPPYVVLSLAAGGNLKDRLARAPDGGRLPVNLGARILFQAAYALQHAHAHGVVHGDLKPENVLFDGAGNVKVSDFGVARVVEKAPGQGPPVYVGVGNPSYLSPEQLHNSGDVTVLSDIYSFGILLYQVATGQLPGRRSPMPSEVNPGYPKSLDTLFDEMTRDKPEERVKTFDDVLAGLYAAFPRDEVLARGNLILFETDPLPPVTAKPEEKPAAAPPGPNGADARTEPG